MRINWGNPGRRLRPIKQLKPWKWKRDTGVIPTADFSIPTNSGYFPVFFF